MPALFIKLLNKLWRLKFYPPFSAFRNSAKDYYKQLPFGLLLSNWFYQRVLGRSSAFPYSVHYTSLIQGAEGIRINKNDISVKTSFAVSGGCYFTVFAGTTLEIGDGTIWSYNVCIQTGNHDFYDHDKYHVASVRIGKNCWIAYGAVILPGVELGDNVVVGANAVVTKSFPSNVVIAGIPAKVIREL